MIEELKNNNYIVVKNFVNPDVAEELGIDFIKFCVQNKVAGDGQVPSPSVYNYLPLLELLCEKTPDVSRIVDEKVLPTYVYSRVYRHNDILEKHTDREECDISLTLNLCSDKPWDIWIETPTGDKCVSLESGDAMFYHGNIAPHWRDKFEGTYCAQAFLHYVYSNGEYSDCYFDKSRTGLNSYKVDLHATQLSDYIMVQRGLIPPEVCDDIVSQIQACPHWEQARIGSSDTVDSSSRNCDYLSLDSVENGKSIDEQLFKYASLFIKKYSNKWSNVDVTCDTGYDLLRYNKGQFYTQHTDSFTQQQRQATCSFVLNDNFSGGEFCFFDRKYKYKLGKGDAIMFPSNFMFPHEILPVTEGSRLAVVTWFV